MKISTFGFLTRRGVRNLGKHWAMTIACIASLSVCMTLNIFASQCGQHGELSGQPERDGGLRGPRGR